MTLNVNYQVPENVLMYLIVFLKQYTFITSSKRPSMSLLAEKKHVWVIYFKRLIGSLPIVNRQLTILAGSLDLSGLLKVWGKRRL